MFRKIMLAVAVLVGGATLSATDASAGYRGYGYHGGPAVSISIGHGYHGGYRSHRRFRHHGYYGHRRHFASYGHRRHFGYYGGRRHHGGYYHRRPRVVIKHVYHHGGYGRRGYGYY